MFTNFEAINKMKNCYDYCKILKLKLKTFCTNETKTSNLKSYNLFYVYSSVILLQFATYPYPGNGNRIETVYQWF